MHGPTGPPPQPQHLTSTQDLLARFRLLPAYNTHVLPYATQFTHDGQPRPAPTRIDKGKAREHDSTNPLDPDINDDGKEKKKKNSYKPLIKGIPGPFLFSCFISQTMIFAQASTQ